MKTILITGINGFIGKNLADELDNNYKIIGLDTNNSDRYHTIIHNLSSNKDIKTKKKVDIVIHLAALTDPRICEEKEELAYKINVDGTKKLLDFSKEKKIKKFIYISTGGIYGYRDKPSTEKTIAKPFDVYTKTKYKAELSVRSYDKFFPITILRLFFPYGDLINKNQLINRILISIDTGKEIYLNNKSHPKINPIYIKDLIGAIKLAVERDVKKFEIFNIAGEEVFSIKDVALIIGREIGKKPKFYYNKKRVDNLLGDIGKIKQTLKFTPKISFKKGISELVNKYKREKKRDIPVDSYPYL